MLVSVSPHHFFFLNAFFNKSKSDRESYELVFAGISMETGMCDNQASATEEKSLKVIEA